jgi:hypothetical protein
VYAVIKPQQQRADGDGNLRKHQVGVSGGNDDDGCGEGGG